MQLIACVPARKILAFMLFCICFTKANAQLTARFSSDRISGCAPLVVQFSDESTGNPTEWKWSLGNGTQSPLKNPSVTYLNPGTYTITLETKNASGTATETKQAYITVHASPVIAFSSTATSGCYPFKVTFTDQSQAVDGTLTNWLWDFGDGTVKNGNEAVVEHTYITPGEYNVTLQATNSFGCKKTDSKPKYIKISDGIQPEFTISAASSCRLPVQYTFTNNSTGTGNLSYEWNFDDGTTSTDIHPNHTFTQARDYNITLTVRNDKGCLNTITKKLTVGETVTEISAPAITCVGEPVNFQNASVPAALSSSWSFGDGSIANVINPVKTFTVPGRYTVTLQNNYGSCQGQVTRQIEVISRSTVDFTADKTIGCKAPFTVNFTSNAPDAISYEWNFGDGNSSTEANPSHTYTTESDFEVTLTITNRAGCKEIKRYNNFIRIRKPVISIINTPFEGCIPLSYRPTLRVETIEPIVNYLWDFGNGATATGPAPTYIYTAVGEFDVTLTYTTQSGCTFTTTGKVRAGNKPVVHFSVNKTLFCASETVNFTDLSTATPPADRWLWFFGDGGVSTAKDPSYKYSDVGPMNVTLQVWSNGCASDPKTITNMLTVKPPVAVFNVTNECTANPFYRKFIDASIQAQTWHWNFGDGNTSTAQNPDHIYARAGQYTVVLTVTNGACSDVYRKDVIILAHNLQLAANSNEICRGSDVNFEVRGANPDHILFYNWHPSVAPGYFGNDKHTQRFITKGDYEVRVDITDINKCIQTLTQPVKVVSPSPNFDPVQTAVCVNNSISFTDKSTPHPGFPITQWEINYGDGPSQVVTPPTFTHTYTTGNTYSVTLTVTDSKGCTESLTKGSVVTIADPRAAFSSPNLFSCTTKDIQFTNQSSGAGLTYSWSFGDGNISNQLHPNHPYLNEGDFTVKLKVVDMYGCTNEEKKDKYISINNPIAKIIYNGSATSECPPFTANFINDSKNYISHTWDFGDGTQTTMKDPDHIYYFPDKYDIVLKVTSHGGCVAEDKVTINVLGPKGSFKFVQKQDCVDADVAFEANTKDDVTFLWDFDNGQTMQTNQPKASYTYTQPGEFKPRMILISNKDGCRVPYPTNDVVRVYGVKTTITLDKDLLCDKGFVQFGESTVTNDLIKSYEWSFGDNSTSSIKNPRHEYKGTGNYPVKLKITTEHGCTDEINSHVKIVQSPKAKITGPGPACVPASFHFAGHLDNADTSTSFKWEWDFANGQKVDVQNPQPVRYEAANDYVVKLKLTNSSGCTDETQYATKVHPLPVLKVTPDFVLCRDQPRVLQATGAATYTWQASPSISCTNCPDPTVNPTADTKYFVTGKSAFGCEATAEVNVSVQQKFTVSVNLGDTLCIGEKYGLKASGADLYQWTPATGLNNATSPNPIAQPGASTIYTVTGRDKNGCFTDSKSIPLVVYPYPKVELGADQTLAVGYSLDLKPTLSTDVTDIKWSPALGLSCTTCPTPTASPKQNITYKIEVKNEGGCKSTDMLSIFMVCKGENMFLPNTFSPNGDANNETFYPRGRGLAYVKNFRIFNRWGEVVFEAANFQVNDRSKGWNGMHKGKPASLDVYVYTIDVVCENNEILNFKGDVTLLR